MEIKVKSLYLKSSPRKVRPILHSLRGLNAEKAYIDLTFTNKKGAKLIASLLKSALAVAKENELELNKLFIKLISCNEGPKLKRRQIKARGRSDAIIKRMCHLNLVLSDTAEPQTEKKEIKKKVSDREEAAVESKKPEEKKTVSKKTKPMTEKI